MGWFSMSYLKEILGKNFVYDNDKPFVRQIENYAADNKIVLPANYRSEAARRIKINTMIQFNDVRRHIKGKYLRDWIKIWKTLLK